MIKLVVIKAEGDYALGQEVDLDLAAARDLLRKNVAVLNSDFSVNDYPETAAAKTKTEKRGKSGSRSANSSNKQTAYAGAS